MAEVLTIRRITLMGGPIPKAQAHSERGHLFLTKPEVRKDIREIQRTLNADSDSECSVRSEEVLDCRNDYPVKPRRNPRWVVNREGVPADPMSPRAGPEHEMGARQETIYYNVGVVDNHMAYLKSVQTQRPELWAQEEERDRLDSLRQSTQNALLNQSKRIHAARKEQEGYFRALQGLHMRGLLLQNSHVRQTTMTWDVLNSLKRRKAACTLLENDIQRLKALYTNAKPVRSTAKNKDGQRNGKMSPDPVSEPGATSVLRVFVSPGGAAADGREIVVYRGMWVQSPMGLATVERIVPHEEKVVLRLPFGVMYAHLRRMITWGMQPPAEDMAESYLDSAATAAAAGGAGGGGGGGVPGVDTLDASSDRALNVKWRGLRNALSMPSEASRGITSFLSGLTDAEQAAHMAALADGQDGGAGGLPAYENPLADVQEPEEADPENDNRLLFSLSQGSLGGAELMKQYHLPVVHDPNRARALMRARLVERIGEGISITDAKLVVAAPLALPHLVAQKLMQRQSEVHLCPGALGGTNDQQPGSTASLTWDANTEIMRRSLQERKASVAQLEDELYRTMCEVSASRRRAARLSVETSSLRMSMFTRRVRHRNHLSDMGLASGAHPLHMLDQPSQQFVSVAAAAAAAAPQSAVPGVELTLPKATATKAEIKPRTSAPRHSKDKDKDKDKAVALVSKVTGRARPQNDAGEDDNGSDADEVLRGKRARGESSETEESGAETESPRDEAAAAAPAAAAAASAAAAAAAAGNRGKPKKKRA